MLDVVQDFGAGPSALTVDSFQHDNRIIRLLIPAMQIEIVNPIVGQKAEVLDHIDGSRTEQIEILTIQTGFIFDDCYPRREVVIMEDLEVNVIGLRDLRAIKHAGNRPQDLQDIANLQFRDSKIP